MAPARLRPYPPASCMRGSRSCMAAKVSSWITDGVTVLVGLMRRISAGSSMCRWSSRMGPSARMASKAGLTCSNSENKPICPCHSCKPGGIAADGTCTSSTQKRMGLMEWLLIPCHGEVRCAVGVVEQRDKLGQQIWHERPEVITQRFCRPKIHNVVQILC
jgi:hypothetical protein